MYMSKKEKIKDKQLKNNRGITLVALVVTIVVLLILAGITITMLFSDNGIIKKAQEAANKTAQDQKNTEEGLNNLLNQMNEALGGGSSKLKKGELVPVETKYATYTDDTASAPIPGGYCVVNDVTIGGTLKENKVGTGLVISDLANDTLNNDEIDGNKGNQFVWVPVNDEQLTRMYDATNKRGNLYDFGTYNSSTQTWTPYETPQIKTYSASGFREPDILASTSNGDASTTSGRGISQLKDVVGITATVGAADENQSILDNWKKELQDKFDEMIKSVERYKGFYIGRYETGSWNATDKTNVPKVQKGQTVGLSGANWYQQYAQTKNLIKMKDASNNYIDNPNVEASMIWGCQFDRTLEWIAQTNLTEDGKPNYGLLTNSSSWGNYKNYKEVTGDTSTAEAGTKTLPSGTNQNWQKNNIYDLAGNAFDWTIEADNTDLRVLRGGYYGNSVSSSPASSRGDKLPYCSDSNLGSRSTLYVKLNTGS